jgi:tyrosyl-tRNA synthetase
MSDSICSNMSDMSVTRGDGTEMELEPYIDEVFLQLQQFQNGLHCSIRELCMIPEQDADEISMWSKILQIDDSILGLTELFTELRSITRQIAGPISKENKIEIQKLIADEKTRIKFEKDQAKVAKAALKAEAVALKAETVSQR